MSFFYDIFISLMVLGFRVFSLFNEKAKDGIQGRKESLSIIKEKLKDRKVIWMHASSLGEYEQGLPVLENLKKRYSTHKVLVTFFSPSGYKNVVNKPHIADAICYLPFDRKKEIKHFTANFKTDFFFTVKYDFWYHLLRELKNQGAKTFVVSALFYEKQVFFKPYGKWFVHQLKNNIDWFFHQTKKSEELAKKIGLQQSSTSGDTRFDRVRQIRERDNFVSFIDDFKGDSPLIVFGSSWKEEERIAKILAQKSSKTKIIIAPHDLKRISYLKEEFPTAIFYSELLNAKQLSPNAYQILIIDSIGILSKVYSYADIAVIGGGFHSAGLHNILEAATFGIPVIFGNHYRKNPEADSIINHNGGKSFSNETETVDFLLNLLSDQNLLHQMSKSAKDFINAQPKSTDIIISKIINN